MHQVLFIRLLKEKTNDGFKQIYDAYSCKLYSFILQVTDDEEKTSRLLSDTFLKIWNELPVIKLNNPTPFLFLLQKTSAVILEDAGNPDVMKIRIVNSIKQIRTQDTSLKVIVPLHSQTIFSSGEIMPRPSA